MASDPLIDEVRQRRRDLYARYDNNLEKVAGAIRQLQARHPKKVFSRRRHACMPASPACITTGEQIEGDAG